MTSLERVLTTLSHREPDRVPLFLMLTMHAPRNSVSPSASISRRRSRSWKDNCACAPGTARLLMPVLLRALEVEAWGGEVVFREDGPANSGEPLIKKPEQILELVPPGIGTRPAWAKCCALSKCSKAG